MNIGQINTIYFSASGTTKKIVCEIAGHFEKVPLREYDITSGQKEIISFKDEDLVIVGMPVYAGRIPQIMIDELNKFTGNDTPAIITCIYGNRDYDDALLELKNVMSRNGFKIISAAAFIAQHSIFPTVGSGRPDEKDKVLIGKFVEDSIKSLYSINNIKEIPDITTKGNYPYKEVKAIPLYPRAGYRCNKCGICVKKCPVQAIDPLTPKKTDKTRCISCARCIAVCPQNARGFKSILYYLAKRKFSRLYTARKEPDIYIS